MVYSIDMKTVNSWLFSSEYEIFINVFGLMVSSVLLCLKLDLIVKSIDWFHIFIPMFIGDFLQVYFNLIVFVRLTHEYEKRFAILRFTSSFMLLLLRFVFKLLLYFHLSGHMKTKFTFISLPLFMFFVILLFRSCMIKRTYLSNWNIQKSPQKKQLLVNFLSLLNVCLLTYCSIFNLLSFNLTWSEG